MFIVGRAVSGIGFAGIIGGVLNIISRIMPLRRRPLYCGMLSGVESAAVIAAPIVGGALTQSLGWRWCFWINLPIGGVTLLMTTFLVSDLRHSDTGMTTKQKLAQIDLTSNLLLIPAVTSLFIALSWAGIKYSWTDGEVIGLIITFVVLLTVFAYHQHMRGDAAALPPRIIRKLSIIAGAIFAIGTNSAINVLEYYLPTYYQTVREYSPGTSGYMIIPIIVGSTIGTFLCGLGTSKIGYYTPFMLFASITMPIFSGLITTFNATTSFIQLILYSGAFGFASGIGFNAPISAIQVVLPIEDVSLGISIILFAQHIGPAVTMAVAQVIFINRLSTNLVGTISHLDSASIQNSGLTEIIKYAPAAQHIEILEGISRSLDETWYLVVGLTCVTLIGSLLMEWRSVKHKS
jgi:MFS family permease